MIIYMYHLDKSKFLSNIAWNSELFKDIKANFRALS